MEKTFKTVYVSHPLRGDMDPARPDISRVFDNLNDTAGICRKIVGSCPGVLPLSPLHAFSFLEVFTEDDKALELDLKMMKFADELWVFGEWERSAGCQAEIARARELVIPICYGNGKAVIPRRFYCPRLDDVYDGDPSQATVPAWNMARASIRLGCTPHCECMCGCGGPREYKPPRDVWPSPPIPLKVRER
jgi:hypothetical protein